MAYKMKGLSGFGPTKSKSIVAAKKKKIKTSKSPTFEYGHEESEKIMKLRRKGLIPGSQKFGKK
tara:strand:+ start:1345 stop:1536 length:192 start_codon:yes stop_codon:yes gene_type:complete